jgi:hypothetical protein
MDDGRSVDPLASPAGWERVEIDDRRNNSDRRGVSRRKILRGGRTVWQNGDFAECIIHNLSDSGAQLQGRGPLPKMFDLVIEDDALLRPCCVVWRQSNRVGVKFQHEFHWASAQLSY